MHRLNSRIDSNLQSHHLFFSRMAASTKAQHINAAFVLSAFDRKTISRRTNVAEFSRRCVRELSAFPPKFPQNFRKSLVDGVRMASCRWFESR
jgi:hypothetical protein